LVAYLPEGESEKRLAALDRYVDSLRAAGCNVDPWSFRTEEVEEQEWRERWRDFFVPTRVGRRFVVCPSWHEWTVSGDDVVVLVDPGQAFGTGAHPSTRLCLRAIERIARIGPAPRSVLDVGTGSGILAAAAALIWRTGCTVTAVDEDPVAVEAAQRTLLDNALSSRVRTLPISLMSVEDAFDLVLANLQADVLREQRESLTGLVHSGGRLVLSGLLREEARRIAEDYCESGDVEAEYSEDEGEWRSLSLRRR
jgi:ribosomal protein L11 methyltransferase